MNTHPKWFTVLLRAQGWVFFRDAFAKAKPGALFLFTETTHRLWPELIAIACDVFEGPVPVSIPTDLPGQCGSTLVFMKSDGRAVTHDMPRVRVASRSIPPQSRG